MWERRTAGLVRLAGLLIREKQRRVLAVYGRAGCVAIGAILTGFAASVAWTAFRLLQDASPAAVSPALSWLWAGWIALGLFTGKDLFWHIRLDGLRAFPFRGFLPLYIFTFLLSLASFPLLLVLCVFEIAGTAPCPPSPAGLLLISLACALYASSVRLVISLAGALFYRGGSLSNKVKLSLFGSAAVICGTAWIAGFPQGAAFSRLLPGLHFCDVLMRSAVYRPLLSLAGIVFVLASADFFLQRNLAYSGICGPRARVGRAVSRGKLLLVHPSWPSTLWRISMLGWLRNRNAVFLMLWGGLYGFFFVTFLSRPKNELDFILFGPMVLIFHSHLRGNLLGVDHKGIWLYYMFPVPVRESLRAKNRTLSLIQGGMLAALILAGLMPPAAALDVSVWFQILSCACSCILFGEICGSYFSLRFPEPIERSFHFSGGMTVGGLIIPFLQILLIGAFAGLTTLTRWLAHPLLFWLELVALPALLWVAVSILLPGWIQRTMVSERKTILAKLSVFSS